MNGDQEETKILFVDDEAMLLAGIERRFRHRFAIKTAHGPFEALEILKQEGQFGVVVSDLRMPRMDGIEFLKRVREMMPDTVRIMLTGQGGFEDAVQAVNEGYIFRFLTKPCQAETLAKSLDMAIRQYHLVIAERELLEKTLQGTIKTLSELLSITNPAASSRAKRIRGVMEWLAAKLQVEPFWEWEAAAMLFQIGAILLPSNPLEKMYTRSSLAEEDKELLNRFPAIGARLLTSIPRLEGVVAIIAYHRLRYDGCNSSAKLPRGEAIPLGARVLGAALELDLLRTLHPEMAMRVAVELMSADLGRFDPIILSLLANNIREERSYSEKLLKVDQLVQDMIPVENIETSTGLLVLPKGEILTSAFIERLRIFNRTAGIKEPILVRFNER